MGVGGQNKSGPSSSLHFRAGGPTSNIHFRGILKKWPKVAQRQTYYTTALTFDITVTARVAVNLYTPRGEHTFDENILE